jgi:hypothetical protein
MSVTVDPVPIEIRAQIEASAVFDALRRGDLTAAARAQERLREMGWHLTREVPKQPRPRRRRRYPRIGTEEGGA